MTNPILATDSYKQSHFRQYPPEADVISAYVEARPGGASDQVLFLGLQPPDRLSRTAGDARRCGRGRGTLRGAWRAVQPRRVGAIVTDHGGHLPLEIAPCPKAWWCPRACRWCRWKTPIRACPG
jgi:nicotinamide phosphoribosyltransferase